MAEDAICQDEKLWGRNRLDSTLKSEKYCPFLLYLDDTLAYKEHEMTVPGILRLDVKKVHRRGWSFQDEKKKNHKTIKKPWGIGLDFKGWMKFK